MFACDASVDVVDVVAVVVFALLGSVVGAVLVVGCRVLLDPAAGAIVVVDCCTRVVVALYFPDNPLCARQ